MTHHRKFGGLFALAIMTACSPAQSVDRNVSSSDTSDLKSFMETGQYERIHLKKLPSGHDVVSAKINGVEADFILDTGANFTIVDQVHLETFKILGPPIDRETSAGAGGDFDYAVYEVGSVSVAGRQTDVDEVFVADVNEVLSALSRFHGKPLKGLVGQDFMLGGQGVIDVVAEDLYVREPETIAACEAQNNCDLGLDTFLTVQNYQRLSLEQSAVNFLFVTVGFEGGEGRFLVDSGSRETFLNMSDLDKFGITDRSRLELGRQTVGAGGTLQTYRLDVADFSVGGADLDVPQIGVIDLSAVEANIASRGGGDIDGVIGQDILQSHKAIIDLSGNGLFLKGVEGE